MAPSLIFFPANTSSVTCRNDKVELRAVDSSNFKGIRISCYGREFKTTTAVSHHFLCSISPHSRDDSVQYNSCFSNGNENNRNFVSNRVPILPDGMKLLRQLQEFSSAANLSPYQVPSTWELDRCGRQDLANAVRRRGEKVVSQPLLNPKFSCSNDATKQVEPNSGVGDLLESAACESSNWVLEPEAVHYTKIRLQDSATAPEVTDLDPQKRPNLLISQHEVDKNLHDLTDGKDSATVDSTTQVTNSHISNTGFNEVDRKQVLPRTQNVVSFSEVEVSCDEGVGDDEDVAEVFTYKDSSDGKDYESVSQIPVRSLGESIESEAWQKISMLRSKLTSFLPKPVEESMTKPRRNSGVVSDIIAKQRQSEELSHNFEQEKDKLSAGRTNSEAEIARLTALLHVKNLECRKASRELEETKAVLSLVRAKQSAERAQTKLMSVEKDLRLQAAEQAVDSLKLTQVDWWGEGSRVELAGSFNGWKSQFYLLPDLSSKMLLILPGTRSPLLWRTQLWLYPGVYEIKFIVDGNWVLDDRREIVQGHLGQNNLLFVEP